MMQPAHILRSFAMGLSLVLVAACSRPAEIAELRSVVGDQPVVLLSTSTCGYCRKLRADLGSWGVDYADLDVETNRKGRRAYGLVNGRGVPILLVGDTIIHGYSPERARDLLSAADLLPVSSQP